MFMAYNLQGSLYASGSILSRLLLLVIIFISLYYFIYANLHFKLPTPLNILSLLIVIWTIYGIVPLLFGTGNTSIQVNTFDYIKKIYVSLLPIYTFFVFFKKGWLTENMVKRWFIIFIFVAIADFYETRQNFLQEFADKGSYREEVTNNAGYIVLSLLPLLPLFSRRPLLQYVFLFVIMLYVLMGFKRGAILAGTVCTIWLLIRSFRLDSQIMGRREKRNRILRLFSLVLLFVGAVIAVHYFLSTSDYFNARIEETLEGDSSGRDELYSFFFNYFINEDSIFTFLFGNGAYGTLHIFVNGAHNDWLQIAIDNGLVCLILFAAYWISMIKMIYKGNARSNTNIILGMYFIIYFMATLFSMSFSNTPVYATCALGFAMANYEYKNRRYN